MTNLTNKRTLRSALIAAGIVESTFEIRGGGKSIEIELFNYDDLDVFVAKVAHWAGFSTGARSWVLRPYYRPLTPDVDFNHVASAHHW